MEHSAAFTLTLPPGDFGTALATGDADFLANAADASDLERAHKSFERVSSFAPENDYVKLDLATADDVIQGKPLPKTTYVIFETGEGPGLAARIHASPDSG